MNIEYIKNLVLLEDFKKIEDLISNKIVTENQFIRILQKSFDLDKNSGDVLAKIAFYKALTVLEFVQVINFQSKPTSKKTLNESIKRLMSNNGHETVNEIYSHIGLHNTFTNYNVVKLYENFADGLLIDKNIKIPVEIKSRFPQVFDRLNSFYNSLSEIIEVKPNKHIIVQMRIYEVSEKINQSRLKSEIEYFTTLMDKLNFNSFPKFPNGLNFNREFENIKFKISIFCKQTDKLKIGYSSDQKDAFYFSNKFQDFNNTNFVSCSQFTINIEDHVKKLFSYLIIDKCIKNIKNLPQEPRIIAIYSDSLRNPGLSSFFKNSIEKYIEKKQGTCVVGICGFFNERNENIIGISEIIAGKKIRELIRPNCTKPELI